MLEYFVPIRGMKYYMRDHGQMSEAAFMGMFYGHILCTTGLVIGAIELAKYYSI